jgi:hypothetical protein
MPVSLFDVQAHWGWTEISGTHSEWYRDSSNIEELRRKRKDGMSFKELSADEKYLLAFRCAGLRMLLMTFMTGIQEFDLIQLDRSTLGKLWVPPNVWRGSLGTWHQFSRYINTPTEEGKDARKLVIDPEEYQPPQDPIIIGRSFDWLVMIDGYHRAALFWKFAPANGTIPAYFPKGVELSDTDYSEATM